ncbi:MAG: DDE-type integrase/transposase/recombinase [Clostridiales bacterium]|jgi:hypothetical protein|nr:DDE-type integrase/transposase/recombinase [Clostridiales bacterium]
MTDNRKPEEIAVSRHKIISPVLVALETGEDAAKIAELKKEACASNGISRRTLRRWLTEYKGRGFEGLKPMSRSNQNGIEILELEGRAEPGFLKRTTLQDHLTRRGFSARQMKMYQSGGLAARRFARQDINDMWHSGIKFGPYINIKNGKRQVYLVSFLDDATRYVVHGEFYDSLDQSVVEDCFRKAILKEGIPKRVYFDNGKQFRNIWLGERYHTRTHGGLKDGETPEIAYKNSKAPLRFLSADAVALAFMRFETRKADKCGCISFGRKLYEVGITFAGQTVNILYGPADTSVLTVEHPVTRASVQVTELDIGEHTGARPKLPKCMGMALAGTSRLLDEKEKRYREHQERVRRAISFKDINSTALKEGESHV